MLHTGFTFNSRQQRLVLGGDLQTVWRETVLSSGSEVTHPVTDSPLAFILTL